MDARRGDEHVPETSTARRPDAADAEFGRNPKGRGFFRWMPALLGLGASGF